MAKVPKPQELVDNLLKTPNLLRGDVPEKHWTEIPVEFKPGNFCYAGKSKIVDYHGFPNAREWSPADEDWKLPDNWEETILEGFRDRLKRFRSFKVFMDICVRCGACADKCHFFIGGGDPKNPDVKRKSAERTFMPAARAGIYKTPGNPDPFKGDEIGWARVSGNTLSVYLARIRDDGRYEIQRYDRTLSDLGMQLEFTRLRDGEKVRVVKGRAVKTGK